MHALIDADYKKRLKRQISGDIISFMQAHHDSPDAYLVHFDYQWRQGHRPRAVYLVQKPAAASRLYRV
jgi:hypothetical protein